MQLVIVGIKDTGYGQEKRGSHHWPNLSATVGTQAKSRYPWPCPVLGRYQA